ncbi:MAG: hypothetical protein KJP08_00075 [Gammaproteobacteria bacterium]|nr:hypothetical protein [Gammaproteobacteria bacterium]NNL63948.1 hypothetical protein [Woeseiaceae bacterium]
MNDYVKDNRADRLDRVAMQLATEIAPERDLWPGIEQAIAAPRRRMTWLAQAAAVVLLVGASSTVTWMVAKDDRPVAMASPDLVFERAAFGGDYNLGPGFQDARNSLRAEMDAELGSLSPEVQADVQANLDVIHQAIVDINAELEKDPDNALLQQKLLASYRQELNLLRRVSGLSRNVMTRSDI